MPNNRYDLAKRLTVFHEPDVPISREHELGVRVSTKKGV
jgi:hypothetical protein